MSNAILARRIRDYPGQLFLECQQSPTHSWTLLSRDNDEPVMRIRYEYQLTHLTKGQALRLVSPEGVVLLEKTIE